MLNSANLKYVKLHPLSEYGQVRMPDLSCIFMCLRRFFRCANFVSQISHRMVTLLCVFICLAKFCRLKQDRRRFSTGPGRFVVIVNHT